MSGEGAGGALGVGGTGGKGGRFEPYPLTLHSSRVFFISSHSLFNLQHAPQRVERPATLCRPRAAKAPPSQWCAPVSSVSSVDTSTSTRILFKHALTTSLAHSDPLGFVLKSSPILRPSPGDDREHPNAERRHILPLLDFFPPYCVGADCVLFSPLLLSPLLLSSPLLPPLLPD